MACVARYYEVAIATIRKTILQYSQGLHPFPRPDYILDNRMKYSRVKVKRWYKDISKCLDGDTNPAASMLRSIDVSQSGRMSGNKTYVNNNDLSDRQDSEQVDGEQPCEGQCRYVQAMKEVGVGIHPPTGMVPLLYTHSPIRIEEIVSRIHKQSGGDDGEFDGSSRRRYTDVGRRRGSAHGEADSFSSEVVSVAGNVSSRVLGGDGDGGSGEDRGVDAVAVAGDVGDTEGLSSPKDGGDSPQCGDCQTPVHGDTGVLGGRAPHANGSVGVDVSRIDRVVLSLESLCDYLRVLEGRVVKLEKGTK